MGVDDQTIAEDYALTRIGREPLRERVLYRLRKEPLFTSNHNALLNMFACRSVASPKVRFCYPIDSMHFISRETMLAFLSMLEETYCGVENYVNQYCGLSDQDIDTIRTNILVTTNAPV